MNDTTVKVLKSTSFGIMALALVMGASIVLLSIWKGRRAQRELAVKETLEQVEA
jgi:hypothetical protein